MAQYSQTETDIHAEAIQRFDSVIQAVQEERALALQDRRFNDIAGAQWEGQWGEQAENSIMVEINKAAQGVEKIIGDYRANRMIVNFRGVGKGSDEETADLLDGMFRADYYTSGGQLATDNAFEDAVKGGMGAWQLSNVYYDERDPDDERQRVAFELIADADQCVFWDPNSKRADKSDAKWCIKLTAMAKATYEAEYPKGCSSWPVGLVKTYYEWYTPDVVMVASYYVIELKEEQRHTLQHISTGEERREWASDLEKGELADLKTQGWKLVRTRPIKRQRVKKYILNGTEILEEGRYIAGPNIPIVMVYGKRSFIDNMERTQGHVRRAKDPQRVYNMQISKLTEMAAAAPIERPIFDPEQVQGFGDQWASANRDRAPYALARALRNEDGSVAVAGPLGKVEPPQLSPVMAALIQQTSADIVEISAGDDGAAMTQSNVSADAMDIAAQRTDAKSAIYMDNMKQAWQRCGTVWLGMTRDNLVIEGDEVETMSADDSPVLSTAVIAEPFTDDKGYRIRNDIAKGSYHVIVDVTEATATRRDKTVKTCINGAQIVGAADPELSAALTLTAILNMDGEGITDLQGWARQRALGMGLVKPTPEEQQEIDQAQQNQQPDAQTQAVQAQAEALAATAQKEAALAQKAQADTALSVAKTAQTEADTAKTKVETAQGAVDHRVGFVERLRQGAQGFFSPKPNSGGQPGAPR